MLGHLIDEFLVAVFRLFFDGLGHDLDARQRIPDLVGHRRGEGAEEGEELFGQLGEVGEEDVARGEAEGVKAVGEAIRFPVQVGKGVVGTLQGGRSRISALTSSTPTG